MKKVSLVLVILSIFILSCGDEAASDNDGGVSDNEAVTDDDVTDEEEAKDEVDEKENMDTNEIVDDEAVDEELNDEVTDETDDSETPDESQGASDEALTCCQEIVKEWFRCEGSFDFDAVTGCVDCVAGIESCETFNPLDAENFLCKTECGAVCPTVALKGDGSGTDRRLIADEYCKFIMNPACDLRNTDFSSLGAIEGLDACYDM